MQDTHPDVYQQKDLVVLIDDYSDYSEQYSVFGSNYMFIILKAECVIVLLNMIPWK